MKNFELMGRMKTLGVFEVFVSLFAAGIPSFFVWLMLGDLGMSEVAEKGTLVVSFVVFFVACALNIAKNRSR